MEKVTISVKPETSWNPNHRMFDHQVVIPDDEDLKKAKQREAENLEIAAEYISSSGKRLTIDNDGNITSREAQPDQKEKF